VSTVEEYGLQYRVEVPRLIDALVAAAQAGDSDRVTQLRPFSGELHALIGNLLGRLLPGVER
jgi:hypothetical protein